MAPLVRVVSVLPLEIEERLAEFLASGRTGSVSLHVNAGSIQSWEIRETGRVAGARRSGV